MKKALRNAAIPLARYNLSGLVNNLAWKAINKFERKMSEKGAITAEKEFNYFKWRYEWHY